jgi:hypothetical protein
MHNISHDLLEIQHNIWSMLDEYIRSKLKGDPELKGECKVIQLPTPELNNQLQTPLSYEEPE